jgi:Carboxypeptidase regulatory-like domain/TonB dependent receptor
MRKTLLDPSNARCHNGIGNLNLAARPHCSWLRKRSVWLGALATLLCFAAQLQGQVRFGGVVGFVSDPSGRAVGGATVTLTNVGTNEIRTAPTGSAGSYAFANVPPGEYRVAIEQSGFEQFTAQNVEVQVDQTTRVDAALQLGSVSQSVEVTSSAITLQTDTSSLGAVVTNQTVQNLPISGLNVNNLIALVPGVSAGGSTYGTPAGDQAGGARTNSIAFGNYFIGGAFGNQSAFFVDGASVNGPANNVNGLIPAPDTVQEFRVVTNNVSAQYGSYAGGVVNISTKSGTNAFHGTAYDYLRNTIFNANDFFTNHAGLPRAPLVQNQFGGAVGGPIRRNKTFFFFGYDGLRTHSAVLSTTTVPTAAELSGDFSAPGLPPIYDPTTGQQFSCNNVLNVICPNRIDHSAQLILADSFPASGPNQSGLVNNLIRDYPTGAVQDQYTGRVDTTIGEKNHLFGRYTHWKVISTPYDAWGTHTQGQGLTGLFSHQAVLGDTYTINSKTVLDVRASYMRIFQNEAPDSTNVDLSKYGPDWATIQSQFVGGPQRGATSYPALSFDGTPGFAATDLTATNGIGSQLYWMQNVYGFSGNLIKIVGQHQINVGADIHREQWIAESNFTGVALTFDNEFTANPSAPATTGDALASMLLGVPQLTDGANIKETGSYYTTYGFYVEDTYQATRNLTATLGLRWDQPGVYSESHNSNTVFLPNDLAPVGNVTSFVNPVTGTTEQLKGLFSLVDSPAWPSQREDNLHWDLFAPRVGLAYRFGSETVVRAGYGLSYLPFSLAQDDTGVSPINGITTSVANTFEVTTGQPNSITATVANPFPQGVLQPPGRNANLASYYGTSVVSRVPGQKAAYQQQWNLAVERQISHDGTVTVAYAGSKGTHLLMQGFATAPNLNINQVPDQYLALGQATLEQQVANPFYGVITSPASPLSQPTIPEGDLLKPFPQYSRVLALDPQDGFSSYNSLQIAVHQRFWGSGEVMAAYTWSKLISNTDSITNFLDPGNIFGGTIQDNTNITEGAKSLSEYDIPQQLTFGYTVPLPFGKGQRYLTDAGPIVSAIAGGWSWSGLTTISSGPPIAMVEFESATLQQFGAGNGFIFAPGDFIQPDVMPGCNKSVPGSREYRALNGWFNAACFPTTTSPTAFGNEPRVDSGMRMDGINNWDMSLSKNIPIKESLNLKFGVEAYNIFNRTRFAGPNPIAGLPGATGIVTSTAGPPRNIEFSLMLNF